MVNKTARNLAKMAEHLYSAKRIEESRDIFFAAIRLAHKENPLMDVLGEFGFEPSEVFEYGPNGKLDEIDTTENSVHRDKKGVGTQEIWMHVDPETSEIQYGYVHHGGGYGHKHSYYDNLDDLVAHIAEEDQEAESNLGEDHPCQSGSPCACGGKCKESSSTIFKKASEKKKPNRPLGKPFRTPGGPKKFSVYVKNEKGNIVKVNFGDPNMEIKRDDPGRKKNFRARHNCENPGPRDKARYWSCKMWSKPSVTNIIKGK
jgi:hypothetical protein